MRQDFVFLILALHPARFSVLIHTFYDKVLRRAAVRRIIFYDGISVGIELQRRIPINSASQVGAGRILLFGRVVGGMIEFDGITVS